MISYRQLASTALVSILAAALGYLLGQKAGVSPLVTSTLEGWQTHLDTINGFSVRYPLAESAIPFEEGQLTLPPAVGGKERWLKISVLDQSDKILSTTRCLMLEGSSFTTDRFINGRRYCVSQQDSGAAGSDYRTDAYVTKVGEKYVVLSFTSRHTNDVHVYGECDGDWDLSKQICQEYAFDPIRDLKLFDDIVATLTAK